MDVTTRDRRFLTGMPAPVLAAIGVAWALALTVEAAGRSDLMSHDGLIASGAPLANAFAIHLGAWAAMVVAMMLPTTLPLLRLFRASAAGQERPAAALGALVSGYVLVWTAFGALAFAIDLGLHAAIASSPGIHPRSGRSVAQRSPSQASSSSAR